MPWEWGGAEGARMEQGERWETTRQRGQDCENTRQQDSENTRPQDSMSVCACPALVFRCLPLALRLLAAT